MAPLSISYVPNIQQLSMETNFLLILETVIHLYIRLLKTSESVIIFFNNPQFIHF